MDTFLSLGPLNDRINDDMPYHKAPERFGKIAPHGMPQAVATLVHFRSMPLIVI
jgi:hypothetical protein